MSPRTKPAKYIGTWKWDVGSVDTMGGVFGMFFIEASSHGYRKGTNWKSIKGPIIKTKQEAINLAKAKIQELNKAKRK